MINTSKTIKDFLSLLFLIQFQILTSTTHFRKKATYSESPLTTHRSPYHPLKQFQLSFKRRVFNGRVKPGRCFHDSFAVTEGVKRIFSMIIPCAAKSSSPKRK